MKNALDSNIMQTKTVGNIVELLKRVRTITKTSTDNAKDINEEIDFVIGYYNKTKKRATHKKDISFVYNKSSNGMYKVNI